MVPLFLATLLFLAACSTTTQESDSCGDNVIDVGEECDGEALGGVNCVGLGYYGGVVSCNSACVLDISQCVAEGRCGDNILHGEHNEECDGASMNGAKCEDLGYSGGAMTCTQTCSLDFSGCESDCDRDAIYYDSRDTSCAPDHYCGRTDDSSAIVCLDETSRDNIEFYQACEGDDCRQGAICTSFAENPRCLPLCNLTNHNYCPGDASCMLQRKDGESYAQVCMPTSICDPVANTGCYLLDSCYYIEQIHKTKCISLGFTDLSLEPHVGEECDPDDENHVSCVPGAMCVRAFAPLMPSFCRALCYYPNADLCEAGETCISAGVPGLGYCVVQ